jgi:hypothetical protein
MAGYLKALDVALPSPPVIGFVKGLTVSARLIDNWGYVVI